VSSLHDRTGLTIDQAAREIPRLRATNAALLEALEGMLSDYAEHGEIKNGSFQIARAALAKARGAA
jgi:hypothetical protein